MLKQPILSREEVERLWFEKMGHSIASGRMVGDAQAFAAALESRLLEKLCEEPIYQTRWEHPYTIWGDVPKSDYDSYQQHGYAERRIVYELKEKHHG